MLIAWTQLTLIAYAIVRANAPKRLILSNLSGAADARAPRCEANRALDGEFPTRFALKALCLPFLPGRT